MSILVVQIPPRPRGGRPGAADAGDRPSGEFSYVLSPDGLSVGAQGRASVTQLPRADTVVAVLPDGDVGWHRVTLPKAPPSKLRAALVGILEEALLDEADTTHLALAPAATAGQLTWVAAVDKPWLAAQLALLEKAQRGVDRVVPSSWPDEVATGHFCEAEGSDTASPENITLVWADGAGVACLGLQGSLARALVPATAGGTEPAVRWTATPAVAAPAERWLGAPVLVLPHEQRMLQATRSLWNLRQFDLAPRHRGMRALRDAMMRFLSPAYRPVRWGLIALVVANLVGVNLWAWHLRHAVTNKQHLMVQVLQTAYPQVKVVIDAPTQMQRETDTLRAAAGKAGDGDLESLLQAAASAWPPDRPPVESVRFVPGKLTLSAAGWTPEQVAQFRSQLQPAGWRVDTDGNQLVLSRGDAGSRT